jgi:tetratricopeptide (TPR) repeat protein
MEPLGASGVNAFPGLTEAEALLRKGMKDQAALAVIQHLRQHPNEPRGLALLGGIAMETGAFVQAEQFLRRAISLGSTSLEVRGDLALVILKQDRLDEALAVLAELERTSGELRFTATRASTLDRLGRTQEALALHAKVVSDPRAEAQHWIGYGHSLRFAGRTDDAIAAFRHVLADDPERGEAWWGLADIKSEVLSDEDVQVMEREVARAVDLLNVVPLHMALGRGWHHRGQYERAFTHYRQGNRLRADLFKYNPDELTREIDQFIAMTKPGSLGVPAASNGPIPVFLISLPRSGSTLLERILNRHPEVEATGELPYIRALMRASLEMHMRRSAFNMPEYLAKLGPDEKRHLGSEYLRRSAMHRQSDAPFFIDKMPSNWSNVLFIREILPQARFIAIRRNALDCCFSNYTHHFGSALAASFDLRHQARAYVDYNRFMDHLTGVAPDLLCSIRYEDLIEDPSAEITKALGYLGLEWTDDLLDFYRSDGSIRTPSAEQVRRPINRSGIGTWRPYEQWLGPLFDELGELAG